MTATYETAKQWVVNVTPCGKTMIHLFVKCSGKVYDKRCKLETLYTYQEA